MAAVPDVGRATRVESRVAPEALATQDLYERYSAQLLGYCFHKLGSREEAEDAVQQTFLNAFRGLKRGIVPEAESAWLFKIAENVCLTRRRSSYRRGRVETPGDIQALQEYVAAPQQMGGDELMQLQRALVGMPATQRKAILLREWQGLSYREIADEMGLSQPAVETLIFRARRSLAEGLERPEERTTLLARLRGGLDLASLAGALKTLLAGGAAAKAIATTAAVVTVAGAVVVAAPEPRGQEAPTATLEHAPAVQSTNERRSAAAPSLVLPGAARHDTPPTRVTPRAARAAAPATVPDAQAAPTPAGTVTVDESPPAPDVAPSPSEPTPEKPTPAPAPAEHEPAGGAAPSTPGTGNAVGKSSPKADKTAAPSTPKAAAETEKAKAPDARPATAEPGPPAASELPPTAQANRGDDALADAEKADKAEKPEKTESEPDAPAKDKA